LARDPSLFVRRLHVNDKDWNGLLEATLLALLENADEGALVFDRDGRCRMIGRRAGELFGIDPAAYVGKSRDDVLAALSEASLESDAFLETVGPLDLQEPPRVVAELEVARPRARRVVWTTFPIVRDGGIFGRLVVLRDVTRERNAERAQKRLQAHLDELSQEDSLTGLLNLRRFLEELEREHGRSARAWDSYAILRIDVDGMTELNSEFGTPLGDAVLSKVAGCLRQSRREYDIVARYEGDEFVALLPGADAVAAQTVAARLTQAVRADPSMLPSRAVTVSVGGGVWVPPSGERGDDILRRSGAALMKARAVGAGQIHIDAGGEG
jgi:diguanylate cyclase (GGDEF)-like protein/PAS domain S-box-containing protein